jgi:hypothetical protein
MHAGVASGARCAAAAVRLAAPAERDPALAVS